MPKTRCSATYPLPGSEFEDGRCERPEGHLGEHEYHDDGGDSAALVSWHEVVRADSVPLRVPEWPGASWGWVPMPFDAGVLRRLWEKQEPIPAGATIWFPKLTNLAG